MISIAKKGLLALMVAVLFAGCGKSDEELVLGNWEYEGGGYPMLTFNPDGTFEEAFEANDIATGTWSIDGKTLIQINDGETDEIRQTIEELDENKLYLILGGQFRMSYQRKDSSE